VSNLETDPAEVVCDETGARAAVEVLETRDVPLGGPRAMGVRRTLPQRGRSLIGAWCFVDHYGPEDHAMDVPPHPHTGLQTVSWLFAGRIDHRDTVGSHQLITPGELNLMTAGRGIAHSEVSTADSGPLHGVQLWVALPDAARHQEPFFEHIAARTTMIGAATAHVFIGSLGGVSSPARVFTDLVGAQLDVPAGSIIDVPVDITHELGVLVDEGDVRVAGTAVAVAHLAYVAPGRDILRIEAHSDARLLLIGGAPLGEPIVMWWNFIGRSHEEIVTFRDEWQETGALGIPGPFGVVDGYDGRPLPAPEIPPIRLRPRE
jgi:redox-sensitive bicupin YhaK (pirin superfamily)